MNQKVKYIDKYYPEDLEREINAFIETLNNEWIVQDIKYFNMEGNDGSCKAFILLRKKSHKVSQRG